MKKLGIIGGTSWNSTALYYDHINREIARRLGGLSSARLAIESIDLAPYAALQNSGELDEAERGNGDERQDNELLHGRFLRRLFRTSRRDVDRRSDIYALRVITYQLLARRLPFSVTGVSETLDAIRTQIPKTLSAVDSRLSGDLGGVVQKALAKAPSARHQTAEAFADDLRCVLRGTRTSIGPGRLNARVRRWTIREENVRWAGLACVVGYGLDCLFFLVYFGLGFISRFRALSILPEHIRYGEFMMNAAVWTALSALLAALNWRVRRAHLTSVWLALAANVSLSIFAGTLLLGLNSYDFGGMLRDPIVRVSILMLFTPLALFAVVVSTLALITIYRRRQWDRPIIDAQPDARRSPAETTTRLS